MRAVAGACISALLLTACGSTAQQRAGGAVGTVQTGRDGLGGTTGTATATTGGTTATSAGAELSPTIGGSTASGATGGGGPVPGRTGPQVGGGSTSTGTTGGSTPAGRLGPGVTAKKVTLGFQYVDVGTGTGFVTGKDVSVGDPKQQAAAVRDWINKHGGMGGRTLELVDYGAPYANYVSNPQQEFNKICTYYTEDNKVLGVAVYVPDETLVRCLARRDVMTVSDGYPLDRKVYSELEQWFYSPGTMSQDRGAEVGVEGLNAIGFYQGAKIGLLRYDNPVYARAEVSLNKALAAKGLKVAERFLIDYSSTAKAESDASAAVLKFRQQGITHVIVLDNSGGIAFAFMQAAENQQYRPYYGLTTNNSPQALAQLAPAEQLKKAKAVSWWWGDVGADQKQQEPPKRPATRAQCLKIMTDAGIDLTGAAAGSAIITCDQLLLFKALMDRANAPNSAALSAAADGLASSYQSPLTYVTTITRGRRDGATVTRLIRYDGGCSCWLYTGPGPSAR